MDWLPIAITPSDWPQVEKDPAGLESDIECASAFENWVVASLAVLKWRM
jgi:hypothetical protein